MTRQLSIFDATASTARKDAGMEAAARNAETDLDKARAIARELCEAHGETDADEVGKLLHARYGIKSLGPAAGSIFKSGFEFTGRRRKSARKTNHARELKVWRLATDTRTNGKTENHQTRNLDV